MKNEEKKCKVLLGIDVEDEMDIEESLSMIDDDELYMINSLKHKMLSEMIEIRNACMECSMIIGLGEDNDYGNYSNVIMFLDKTKIYNSLDRADTILKNMRTIIDKMIK